MSIFQKVSGSIFGSPFGSPFGSDEGIPRQNLLFYARDGVTDSIGLSTITIISGSSWADWVISLEATADLLAADTGHVFFDAADTPRQVRLSALPENILDYAFAGDEKLLIYSEPQSAANVVKIERYLKEVTAYGGYFTFDDSADATVSFRIDTVGAVPWILDNQYVASGAFHNVSKDLTRSISIGVSDPDIESILFYNNGTTPSDAVFDLSILDEMCPTNELWIYRMPLITGNISSLSKMRPVDLQLSNLPLITGDLSSLADMRVTKLYLISVPLLTGDFFSLNEMRPTGTLYLQLANVSQCSDISGVFFTPTTIRCDGCALDQTGVDNVLASIVQGGVLNGTLQIQGGSNAAPSAAGLADKDTLVNDRGWTVTVTA